MSSLVRVERRGSLGLAALSRPERINALNLEMLDALEAKLDEWAEDPDVACVFIYGEGERGFSAGGDVRAIVESMQAEGPAYGEAAFAAEYRIDYKVHTYPKPVVTFGHGAIMGAGLGLFVAGSTRLALADAKLAMPEVTIGLFPDVGASYFLSRMPDGVGFFAAWTALQFTGEDAVSWDLADSVVDGASRDPVIAALAGLPPGSDRDAVRKACAPWMQPSAPGPLSEHRSLAASLGASPDPFGALAELSSSSDPWVAAAGDGFDRASPTSLRLATAILNRGAGMDLGDCFRQELTVAAQCMRHHDFSEGVRARLVDRDPSPDWRPGTLAEVDSALIEAHFVEPWSANPLGHLEKS